jgi:hypothetical protein
LPSAKATGSSPGAAGSKRSGSTNKHSRKTTMREFRLFNRYVIAHLPANTLALADL